MIYETTRKKLNDYFLNVIFPSMETCGLDYNKTIVHLITELSLSRKMVEEFIQGLIESGKLQEIRILELSKDEIAKREAAKREVLKELEKEVGI